MSLCDRCPAPGACCQVMNLSRGGKPYVFWDHDDATTELRELSPELHSFQAVERIQTFKDDESDATYSSWLWTCNALDKKTGRCTRWATRPDLCASYEPASGDGLCVFSQPLENGEESQL